MAQLSIAKQQSFRFNGYAYGLSSISDSSTLFLDEKKHNKKTRKLVVRLHSGAPLKLICSKTYWQFYQSL